MVKKKKKANDIHKKKTPVTTREDVENLIKKQVEKTGENLTKEEKEQQVEVLKKVFLEGKKPFEAMEIPEGFTNHLYKQAYDRYNLGLYKEAEKLFSFLCMLDPRSAKYNLALGATNHKLKNYEIAISYYLATSFIDPSSPVPLFYISDCFEKLDQPKNAFFMLERTIGKCGTDEKCSRLKTRCYQMRKRLAKEHGLDFEDDVPKEEIAEDDAFSQLKVQAEEEL